jgi:hypothetical protein
MLGGLLQDWVMCCADISAPGSTALDDVTPALGCPGATGSGVSGLLLQGSPGFQPLLIDWR